MIPNKINNLFLFIDFLHSNIDKFKKYDEIIAKSRELRQEIGQLDPYSNFADKLKHEKIKVELIKNSKEVKDNIANPITSKAIEFYLIPYCFFIFSASASRS